MVCLFMAVPSWQLTPRWSALKGDGEPRRGAADRDGVALAAARRDKERTCPELVGPGARARLVVLALAGGLRKPRSLCGCWQGLGPDQNPDS